MIKSIFQIAFFLFCLMAWSPNSPAENESFRWSRSVNADSLGEDEILSVTLDSHIYGETRPDYADLRIFDQRSDPVPYLIERLTSNEVVKSIHEVSSEVSGIERPDDNRLVLYLTITTVHPPPVYGIYIDTPLKDFERRVTVSGKASDGEWTVLASGALLYDYTRFIDLRETRVRFTPSQYQTYRVEIDQVTEEKESTLYELERTFQHREEVQRTDRTTIEKRPFRIGRISMWTEERQEVVKVEHKAEYPVVSFENKVEEGDKTTIVLVKTQGEPLTELSIAAEGQNFNRHAEVQVPVVYGGQRTWRAISAGIISQISFRQFKHTKATLTFSEQRAKEYRVVIQNEDNPPLRVSAVTARGNQYHVLFLAGSGEAYRVVYGNDVVAKPKYDAAAILGYLRGGYAPRAVAVGEPIINKKHRAGATGFFNGKIFFGLVVAIFVAILGVAIFKAGKKIKVSAE